jgi:hypothetical protein
MVLAQISGALEYTDNKNIKNDIKTKAEYKKHDIFRLVCRAMIFPTESESRLLSRFSFCDDITEKYMHSIASPDAIFRLREYTVFARIRRRIGGRSKARNELFWPYGVTAYLPPVPRIWYRANLLIWDIIKSAKSCLHTRFLRR